MHLEDANKTDEPMYLYRGADGSVVITREVLQELVESRNNLTMMCKDSEAGIQPFLVIDDTIDEDLYDFDRPDAEGVSHVFPDMPVPKHYGITSDDDLLQLAPNGPNGAILLRRFHWCIFTPSEFDDMPKGTYELRFVATCKEDAEFVAKAVGCDDGLILPIVDAAIDVI